MNFLSQINMEKKEQLKLLENSNWILATLDKESRKLLRIENYKLQELVGAKNTWISSYQGKLQGQGSTFFSGELIVKTNDEKEHIFSYIDEHSFTQDIRAMVGQIRQREWLKRQGDPNGEAFKHLIMIKDEY